MATQPEVRKVVYIAGATSFIILSLATLEGVVAYAYYSFIRCDPLTSKQISNPNQIIPFMVLDIFRNIPGMAGLFIASLFSASLSTMSSGLGSLSAITVEDYVKPNFKTLSDAQLTLIAKLSVPLYGLLAVGVSFMIAEIPGPISEITASILSAISGPTLGLFLYSVFFPWATIKGAMIGTISAVILSSWLSLGDNLSHSLPKTPWATMPSISQCSIHLNSTNFNFTMPLHYSSNATTDTVNDVGRQGLDKYYALSYQWFGLLGMFYCIVVAIATSLIEGLPKSEDVDVRYVLPFCDTFFPFLPGRLRKTLYFGVKFEQRQEWLQSIYRIHRDNKKEPTKKTITAGNAGVTLSVDEHNDSDNIKDEHEEMNLLHQTHQL